MKPFLGAEALIRVGVATTIESSSADGERSVVFEDDGETGYFYARDFNVAGQQWVDALHIYDVEGVGNRDKPRQLKILWTWDWEAAALLINQRPHAVFHFVRHCGYAPDPFPEPDPDSGWSHERIDASLRDLFFPPA